MLNRRVGLLLAATVCLTGCGKHPDFLPTTYPVHGKVTRQDGAPLHGGMIQFQSQAEPSVTTRGAIRDDGTYSLITMRDGLRAEGAVAGPNRVIVTPPDDLDVSRQSAGQQGSGSPPTIYPKPYNVEPCANEFNLILGRPFSEYSSHSRRHDG